eukprot:Colp12_sorted_trinity150504_noHs@13989
MWLKTILVTLVVCGLVNGGEVPVFGEAAQKLWDAYTAKVSYGLQPGCMPFKVDPPPGIPYRGTILLLHGFSACTQQFEKLAHQLAQRGYTSLAPVIPGHGRQFHTVKNKKGELVVEDDISQLFTSDDVIDVFDTFVTQMNDIMRLVGGQKSLTGLSVGGVIAAYATIKDPDVYDRRLITVPAFALHPLQQNIVTAASLLPIVKNLRTQWPGPGCEFERAGGRAGICQFKWSTLGGVVTFGKHVQQLLGKSSRPTMVFGVEDDAAINIEVLVDAMGQMDTHNSSTFRSCLFRKPVPHSYLSQYDTPTEDKFWLPLITDIVADFLADGTFVPTNGSDTLTVKDSQVPVCAEPWTRGYVTCERCRVWAEQTVEEMNEEARNFGKYWYDGLPTCSCSPPDWPVMTSLSTNTSTCYESPMLIDVDVTAKIGRSDFPSCEQWPASSRVCCYDNASQQLLLSNTPPANRKHSSCFTPHLANDVNPATWCLTNCTQTEDLFYTLRPRADANVCQ